MDSKLGMAEFFAMEAGEYLERLDHLVSGTGAPDSLEFQRLTRALRGSALMANQHAIAEAAGAFEQVARAVREGQKQWDDATRSTSTRAVDTLKILVRSAREWTDAESAKARELAADLESFSGRISRPIRAESGGLDSGTRAFIAREGASLGSALDRAATMLAQDPRALEPLQSVLNVMQPLRGLAGLADLPPIPDLLDGIERAVGEATRAGELTSDAAGVFDSAAKALSQATRAVAADGKADPESEEVRRFAHRLSGMLGFDRPIPSIDKLYYDDAGPHVLEQGAPSEVTQLGEVEFVSYGEHLKQVADGLDHARTPTEREFRSHGLAGTVRVLEAGTGSPLAESAAELARAIRTALASGKAVHQEARFAGLLRDASNALSAVAASNRAEVGQKLRAVAAALGAEAAPVVPEPAHVAPASPAPAASPASAAPAASAASPEREAGDLAGSLARYHRYVKTLGLGEPSLSELLAGPPADPAARPTPIAAVAPPAAPAPAARPTPIAVVAPPAAAEPPAAPAPAVEQEEEVVPISEFCYSGSAALDRAITLRGELEAAVAGGVETSDLLDEIFDLIQLGLPDAT